MQASEIISTCVKINARKEWRYCFHLEINNSYLIIVVREKMCKLKSYIVTEDSPNCVNEKPEKREDIFFLLIYIDP